MYNDCTNTIHIHRIIVNLRIDVHSAHCSTFLNPESNGNQFNGTPQYSQYGTYSIEYKSIEYKSEYRASSIPVRVSNSVFNMVLQMQGHDR